LFKTHSTPLEGGRFVRDVIQRGETYGFSLYTDNDVKGGDLKSGDVVNLTVRHVGFTKTPAWGKEGTMVHEFSDQPYTIRQVIRDKYLPVEGAHFPSDTRRRLAESEASDRKLIADSRAARLAQERRTLSYSTFAMASASDAKPETPPAVDAMKIDPPATTTTATAAAANPATGLPPSITQSTAAGTGGGKESIRQIDEYIRQWNSEMTTALAVPNIQERWERMYMIKKNIGDTMAATPYGTMAWFDAGVNKPLERIKQEGKVLVDQPLAYADRQWKAGKLDDKGFMAVKAGLTLPSIPSGAAEDLMTLAQCRLICAPVRAAAHDELESQKDVELERQRLADERAARMNVEKERDVHKRKLDDMEKQIELLKAQADSFKSFKEAASTLAQTPVPKTEAPDDAIAKAAAISVQVRPQQKTFFPISHMGCRPRRRASSRGRGARTRASRSTCPRPLP
jgi:hypothetical protein